MSILPLLALIIGDLVMPDASQDQILQSVQACDAVLESSGLNQEALRSFGWRPRVINGIGKTGGYDINYFQTEPAVVTIQTISTELGGRPFYTCTSYAKVSGENIDNNETIHDLVNHWFSKGAYENNLYGTTYSYSENGRLYTLRGIYLINGPAVQIEVINL